MSRQLPVFGAPLVLGLPELGPERSRPASAFSRPPRRDISNDSTAGAFCEMLEPAMSDDDRPSGYVLTRREALAVLGAGGLAMIGPRRSAMAAGPTCVVRPALTEGPYFVDEKLDRSDIRPGADGTVTSGAPLRLSLRVSRLAAGACAPLPGAVVDLWHCDAMGVYSDTSGGRAGAGKFLRGYQTTDAEGLTRFTTIYPGWYPGRAVHIHFKIRSAAAGGRVHDFTSQLFFDDALTERVHAQAPYAAHGQGRVKNARDGIYRNAGPQLMLAVTPEGAGYVAAFDLALEIG